MKFIYFLALAGIPFHSTAQTSSQSKNVFIITTDGFRWQELFTGADSILINNKKCTKDTSIANEMYWDAAIEQRRKKLMPFFWNVIAKKGQLYGNRLLSNKVNMKNLYKISYPGYNEILTGFADWHFIPNTPVKNSNINILEFLNGKPSFSGKVAAFTSWNVFPFILNEERGKFQVNAGYEMLEEREDSASKIINQLQGSIAGKKNTRYDMLTYVSAREYIQTQHPKILFLSLGETDQAAHRNRYDLYLQHASQVDKMISDLWYYVQTDPYYKDNTTFIITTDHGRGNNTKSWQSHNVFTKGSGDTWLAMIGAGISPLGEVKDDHQSYGNQLVATIALLLGEKFETTHHVGNPIALPSAFDESTAGKNR